MSDQVIRKQATVTTGTIEVILDTTERTCPRIGITLRTAAVGASVISVTGSIDNVTYYSTQVITTGAGPADFSYTLENTWRYVKAEVKGIEAKTLLMTASED